MLYCDKIFLAEIPDNLRGEKAYLLICEMMVATNLTGSGTPPRTFQELACSFFLFGGLQQLTVSLSAVNILLSITAFLGSLLILVALHKDSSLHPPSKLLYRCLATTDLLVGLICQPLYATYWMSLAYEKKSLCRYAKDAGFITSYALCGVSLLTMTAISVDRLLALLLRLRYTQIVTLKRTYIIVAMFWVLSGLAASCFLLDYRITFLYGRIVIPSCLLISIVSYTKIFRTLSHHQAQVQDHIQQQPSHSNALNIARYRKAVNGALWVQLALVVCYAPEIVVEIVMAYSEISSSHLVIKAIAVFLIFFNSTLNPFLYCWKIKEVRQAATQTIKQTLCCPRS